MSEIFDTIILGAGPAGISAGIYASRGNLKTAIIDTSMFGGAPVNYLEIENYPGFSSIEGWELSEKLELHLDKFDVQKFPNVEVSEIDLLSDIKSVKSIDGKEFRAKTIILATGASPQKLNVKGEAENVGRGVSYCAVCDGAFYRDKRVAVVGGGNAAVEEAIYLTRFAKKVYIIHRRDSLRADKIIQERAMKNEKIEFVWNSVVDEIVSKDGLVSSLRLKNVKTDEVSPLIVDGVFIYIGFSPNSKHFNGQLEQDAKGFVVTDSNMRTSVFGVWAIGDVRTTPLRQVITAVADGAIAGVDTIRYLQEQESKVQVKS